MYNNTLILNYKLNCRRVLLCSKFNVKLYKKFLSFKLTTYFNICKYENIKNDNIKINKNNLLTKTKIFYNRNEYVSLRILRYFLYFNFKLLINLGVNNLITNKISVYNGKKAKPINIYKD